MHHRPRRPLNGSSPPLSFVSHHVTLDLDLDLELRSYSWLCQSTARSRARRDSTVRKPLKPPWRPFLIACSGAGRDDRHQLATACIERRAGAQRRCHIEASLAGGEIWGAVVRRSKACAFVLPNLGRRSGSRDPPPTRIIENRAPPAEPIETRAKRALFSRGAGG